MVSCTIYVKYKNHNSQIGHELVHYFADFFRIPISLAGSVVEYLALLLLRLSRRKVVLKSFFAREFVLPSFFLRCPSTFWASDSSEFGWLSASHPKHQQTYHSMGRCSTLGKIAREMVPLMKGCLLLSLDVPSVKKNKTFNFKFSKHFSSNKIITSTQENFWNLISCFVTHSCSFSLSFFVEIFLTSFLGPDAHHLPHCRRHCRKNPSLKGSKIKISHLIIKKAYSF